MKCNSPQEWVEAAIACGADPRIVDGPVDGKTGLPVEPGASWLRTLFVGPVTFESIGSDKYPDRYPEDWRGRN